MRNSRALELLAADLGAEYLHLCTFSGVHTLLDMALWRFKFDVWRKIFSLNAIRRHIVRAYRDAPTSDTAIVQMYDIEYGGGAPHYAYRNALLYHDEFERITGLSRDQLRTGRTIDIGAGSNELLRFCRDMLGIPAEHLYGSDISRASVEIIRRDGFHGSLGRIESLDFPEQFFDLTMLSYFVDYDTDQRATLAEAVRITRPGGTIVLEGFFPCSPFRMSDKDRERIPFLTRGESAAEDIGIICRAVEVEAAALGRHARTLRIAAGRRYICNRRGLRKLPSYFLTFRVA